MYIRKNKRERVGQGEAGRGRGAKKERDRGVDGAMEPYSRGATINRRCQSTRQAGAGVLGAESHRG